MSIQAEAARDGMGFQTRRWGELASKRYIQTVVGALQAAGEGKRGRFGRFLGAQRGLCHPNRGVYVSQQKGICGWRKGGGLRW